MLYLGFNIFPRSVFWSVDFNGRSDNTDVIRLKMNQNPYNPPQDTVAVGPIRISWLQVLMTTSTLGIVVSIIIFYVALTYPLVRPPDWDGGFKFHFLLALSKWGAFTTLILGTVAFMKLRRSALNWILLLLSFSPAIVVIGLFNAWLLFFA